MKFYEAAIKALQDNNNVPMSAKEVWRYTSINNLVNTAGATPESSMSTIILAHSNNSKATTKSTPYFTCVGSNPIKFKLLDSPDTDITSITANHSTIDLLPITSKELDWRCLSYRKEGTDSNIIYKLEDCTEYTYVVEDKYHTTVKIGKTSNNPEQRLSQLRTSNPTLELLIVFPNILYTEEELHSKFIDFRKDREWFFYAKRLQDFVTQETEKAKRLLDCYSKYLELIELEKNLM